MLDDERIKRTAALSGLTLKMGSKFKIDSDVLGGGTI